MMSDSDPSPGLTPDDLLGDPRTNANERHDRKRARDMATMVALLGLVLVGAGLMSILALVLNQLLVFAILAVIVLGGFYLLLHYLVWGRRLDRQLTSEAKSPQFGADPPARTPSLSDSVDSTESNELS